MEKIIKIIQEMSGEYSADQLFGDWLKMYAISISNSSDLNHGEIWKKREAEYIELVKKHKSRISEFVEISGRLCLCLEEDIKDVLGEIYMKGGFGSSVVGQFFTPFHLSYLAAEMALKQHNKGEEIKLMEPSTGGGGMILAVAKILKEKGINYQKEMSVVAQDLDWRAVYMSYIQFSLIGIKAEVIQGDTLAAEIPSKEQIFLTPAQKGMLI